MYENIPEEDKDDEDDSNIIYQLKSEDKITVIEELEDFSFVEFEEESDNNDSSTQPKEGKDKGILSTQEDPNEVVDGNENSSEIENNDDNSNDTIDDMDNQDKNADSDSVEGHDDTPHIWQGYVANKFIKVENTDENADNDSEDDSDEESNNSEPEEDDEESNLDETTESEKTQNGDEENEETQKKEKSAKTFETFAASQTSYQGVALKNQTHVYSKQSRDSDVLKSYSSGSILKYSSLNAQWYQTGVFINGKYHKGYIHTSDVDNAVNNPESLQGVAVQAPTHVYSSASTGSKSLKSYSQGSILKYSTFSKDWYVTGVFVNGKKHTGYIHKSHVEDAEKNSESLQGIGLKSPTHVYTSASTSSKSLKSYKQGSILKYSTFSKDWYKTGVYINGEKQTGYIHKSHVENAVKDSESLQGIGVKSPTHVYASASTGSKSLKSYSQGSILKYSTFSKDWYKTGVYINGEKQTGYIHKSHVEDTFDKQNSEFGVGLISTTKVYTKASKNSKVLKEYKKGSILKYSTFSKNWYVTGVFINGKKQTGYIHKSDVGTPSQSESLRGIGLKQPTNVYQEPFSSAKVLKSYTQGHVLKYSSYANGWYKTGVYIDGKYNVGYIKSSDTESADLEDNQKLIEGSVALKDPTNIYQKASKNSKVIKTYKKGSPLKFRSLSKNWYQARVKINGSYQTGYIHVNDVGQKAINYKTKNYNISFKDYTAMQMRFNHTTNFPNMYVSKSALKKNSSGAWKVQGTNWNVRSAPNTTSSTILGKIDERYTNDTITVSGEQGSFYKINTWILANEEDVVKYLDPSNYAKGSQGYYQFLVLSEPANIDTAEVNSKILTGKGVLVGKASSFEEGAKKYNVNELYLISHALLETGNGTSSLAKGGKYNGVTVYNMYGIGAADTCKPSPYQCGLKYAYDQGWTTPEKAIIGGAEFIGQNYISRGQDTLYKMRWNPDNAAGNYSHQYATDIAWAEKQTSNLTRFYNILDSYTVTFEEPKFN